MKTSSFIRAALLLLSTSVCIGQGIITSLPDFTCKEVMNNNCPGIAEHDCNSINFSVLVNSSYKLSVQIVPQTGCCGCLAEAYIYQGTTLIRCEHNVCGQTCQDWVANVQLSVQVEYTLYVCKISCEDGGDGDCDICGTDCYAWAKVTY